MHLIYDIYMLDYIYIYIFVYLPLTEWIMIRSQYGWLTTIIFSTAQKKPGRQSQFSQTPGRADFSQLLESRIHLALARKPASCYFETSPQGDIDRLKRWRLVETCGDLWTSVDKARFSFKLLVKQPTFQFGAS